MSTHKLTRIIRRCLSFLLIAIGEVSRCLASPLFPNLGVSSSDNLMYVVVTDLALGRDLGGGAREIKGVRFHVHQRTGPINYKDAFRANDRFWGEIWSFYIDQKVNTWAAQGNFALVSNDGEVVVIVNVGPSVSRKMIALSVYHREGITGRLTRSVRLEELWPEEKLALLDKGTGFTDASPQWFAGGEFLLSQDGKTLGYKTQWNSFTSLKLLSEN